MTVISMSLQTFVESEAILQTEEHAIVVKWRVFFVENGKKDVQRLVEK